ncbi:serine/threonine protein kinase [Thalassoglobus sp.]|uniref:serine/threonine protein kinase n=1 Tax=Thalassoglobus sp. TaxID=2795869 RepID=UPI003AA9C640
MSASQERKNESGDELVDFDDEVLEFLDQHCLAMQVGKPLAIPEHLLARHPELSEMLDCMNRLDSFAVAPVTDQNETLLGDTAGFSSSMMQQLPRNFGSFCLEEEIGRGGMGIIYKARHITLQSHFALKMIRTCEFATDEEVRRFYQEARAASRLRHPNIVSVHDAGEQDGFPFLVMTYIEGQTLAEHLKGQELEISQAIDYVIQIAHAVDYLHKQDIIHRDLKPSNILLDHQHNAFVTDFGLAKVYEADSERTVSGTILGTPAYMAPEQAWGKINEITAQCDIYSLGAILYELLTRRPPFVEESPLDQILRLRDSEPPAPGKINPNVPKPLEQICLRCLEKKPEHRYKSAGELANDLQHFQEGEPIALNSVGWWTKLRRWARREPALVVHLAAFLIVALILQIVDWRTAGHRQSYLPVISILVVWTVISVVFQKLMSRGVPFIRRTWIAADAALFTAAVANAEGPVESLVTGYALLIVTSSMWYKPRLVAVTTISSVISYLFLVAYRGDPETPGHFPYLVIGILLVIGGIVISLVRRILKLVTIRSRL